MDNRPSKWRGKFKSPRDFYMRAKMRDAFLEGYEADKGNGDIDPDAPLFDPEFYDFDNLQFDIDPDEVLEDFEQYSPARQQQEIIKCHQSFPYFCHKYVKILHPIRGLIPFVLYKYQQKCIKDYENHRFNIISKFRQGGLTTVTLLWGLWRCLFKLDQQVMLLSKTDREATDIGQMVDRSVEHLPSWLRPNKNEGKWNDHHKTFKATGGALKFYSPEAARGKSVTFLIVDEAAFIPDMETHWAAMWPILSTGGSCVLVSTVNGLGNWYEETYSGAREERNRFHIIDLDYWEHPDYSTKYHPDWIEEQKAQLGEKKFLQEVMRSFLGSGETYISAKIIAELDKATSDNVPIRKLFKKWANRATRAEDIEARKSVIAKDNPVWNPVDAERGAMWVWKEPLDGHEYIIGVDCAEGMGDNADNSAFQVIDSTTLEQVAEFYSNSVPPHVFSQILNEVGIYYNQALLVIEDMGPGGAVLNTLQHELFYENLHFDEKGAKSGRPGIKVSRINRPILLQTMQHRLMNNTIKLNSRRLVRELKTFEYNVNTCRAEAQKGKHDDAIVALCMALLVRESIIRDIPLGADIPLEITQSFKTDVYEEIKREIQAGAPKDWIEDHLDILAPDKDELLPGVMFSMPSRKWHALLKEFGWIILLGVLATEGYCHGEVSNMTWASGNVSINQNSWRHI